MAAAIIVIVAAIVMVMMAAVMMAAVVPSTTAPASTIGSSTASIAKTVSPVIAAMVVTVVVAIVGVVITGVVRVGSSGMVVGASYRPNQSSKQTYRQNMFHRSSFWGTNRLAEESTPSRRLSKINFQEVRSRFVSVGWPFDFNELSPIDIVIPMGVREAETRRDL